MHVTFIKPNMGLSRGRPYVDRGRMEPLTLAVLAGELPTDVTCVMHDDRCEPIPFDQPTDLVAITVEIYMARRAYEISTEYRRRGVKVVMGGPHVSLAPEEASAYANAILIGEGEGVFRTMVEDAAAGRLQSVYYGHLPPVLRGIRVRREIYAGKRYLPVTLTQFGRGCVNHCAYCSTAKLYGGRFALRPPEEVIEEIRAQPRRQLFFVDDNIIADRTAAKELFRLMIPLKRRWFSQATHDFAEDPELVELMRRSGCSGLVVGFESLSQANLTQMRKNCNLIEQYEHAVRTMRSLGLMSWAAFLLGYDQDDRDSIRRTVDWAMKCRFCFAAFNVLMPYPNTPLYEELRAQDRLLRERWWLDPDYRFGDVVFRPARLSPQELSDACLEARVRFSGPWSVLRRATDFKTNAKDLRSIVQYFVYNRLNRRELLRKHGMRLGYHDEAPAPHSKTT